MTRSENGALECGKFYTPATHANKEYITLCATFCWPWWRVTGRGNLGIMAILNVIRLLMQVNVSLASNLDGVLVALAITAVVK